MVASKVSATYKNMFSLGIKVTIIASVDVILMCFQVTTRRTGTIHPEGLCKKGGFKNFAKTTEKHLDRGLFFYKDSGGGPATLLQRGSSIGVFFVNSVKFLKTLIFETL